MERIIRNFNWVARNGYFNILGQGDTLHNLYLVDTGVFIDLENDHKKNPKLYYSPPSKILDSIVTNSRVLITPRVFGEIKDHSSYRINGRKEISNDTFRLLRSLHHYSRDYFEEHSLNGVKPFLVEGEMDLGDRLIDLEERLVFDSTNDEIRKDVWLAASDYFNGDSRKGEKDPISETDLEILNTSVILADELRKYPSEVECVNVLSTDNHVLASIHYLKQHERFRDLKLRAINTRTDLRSYMKK